MIVFVTGSGKRLGRSLALNFAKKGWDVVIHYFESEESAKKTKDEIIKMGQKAYLVKADLRSYSEIEMAFTNTVNEFGIPKVLINNAGVFPKAKKIFEITKDDWEDTIKLNLSAEFYTSKIFVEFARKNSKIVNISSLGAFEIWKNRIPYNVSKSAIIQLTRALARELAPFVSVNTVCPGAIYFETESSENDSAMLKANKIPMKRYATPEEIFEAVYFFSTCSNYITGQFLCVDGGASLIK
jgi:NAD(P)-dependent dehydrogenase (short-subunit alcohol dehydrogenase family)